LSVVDEVYEKQAFETRLIRCVKSCFALINSLIHERRLSND